MKRIVFAVLFVAVLAGCAVHRQIGNDRLTSEAVAKVVKGKTTQQEVLALLGPPQHTRKQTPVPSDPANPVKLPANITAPEIWTYWNYNTEGTTVMVPFYSQTSTQSNNHIVSFFFDDQGVMMDYQETRDGY